MSKRKKQTSVSPKGKVDRCASSAPKSLSAAEARVQAKEASDELDEALEQSFPASDPVAMASTLVSGSRH